MLTVKRSAGVAPEVNLRNPLHVGEEACKPGINLGFEIQGRCRQKSKTGASVTTKMTDVLQKMLFTFFFQNKGLHSELQIRKTAYVLTLVN